MSDPTTERSLEKDVDSSAGVQEPATSQADAEPTGADPRDSTKPSLTEESSNAENPPLPAQGKPKGQLENKDAIPSAGGERLGEKHWGESSIIPDVPKARNEGISSEAGQPTDQVKSNTAANTGGATAGPHDHAPPAVEHKEGLVDKIKDKLPVGKKSG